MATSPLLDSYEAGLLLRETYEQEFNIFNHAANSYQRPLSLVAMHPRENNSEKCPLYRAFKRYRESGVHEAFGLSITEFLALPREYTTLIYNVLAEEAERGDRKVGDKLRDLEKQYGKDGGQG